MNICIPPFCCIPTSRIAGHMVILCWTFWGTARLFFKVTVPFYISMSSVWGFWFFHISANAYYCLFGPDHPSGCAELSHQDQQPGLTLLPCLRTCSLFQQAFLSLSIFFFHLKTHKSLLNPLSLQLPSHLSLPLYNKIPQKDCLNLSPNSFFILASSSIRLLSPPCHQNCYSQGHQYSLYCWTQWPFLSPDWRISSFRTGCSLPPFWTPASWFRPLLPPPPSHSPVLSHSIFLTLIEGFGGSVLGPFTFLFTLLKLMQSHDFKCHPRAFKHPDSSSFRQDLSPELQTHLSNFPWTSNRQLWPDKSQMKHLSPLIKPANPISQQGHHHFFL